MLTFVVGGEPFEVARPFLALHSPKWAQRLLEEPELAARPIELQGEAPRAFGARSSAVSAAFGLR